MIEKIEYNEDLMEELESNFGLLMYAHPFYEWLEDNIENINFKLMKAIITNIVPLGLEGSSYFEAIVNNGVGLENELLVTYNKLEKMFQENKLDIKTYLELSYLGYTGDIIGSKSPVDDILEAIQYKHKEKEY